MTSAKAVTASRALHSPTVAYILVVVFVLSVWAILAGSGAVKSILLPNPGASFAALIEILSDPLALAATIGATTYAVLAGFAFAAALGTIVGLVAGSGMLLSRAYEPLLGNLAAIPVVLLYPLLLGAMGSGPSAKIVVGAIAAGLPIAISTHWATRAVDSELLEAARSMGASRLCTVGRVIIPSILPGVFAGLRTGIGLAVVTVVAGEFLSSREGLGLQLARAGEGFQTATLFAWLIVTVIYTAALIALLNVTQTLITRKVHT